MLYGLTSYWDVAKYALVLLPIRMLLEFARLVYRYGFAPFPYAWANDLLPIHDGISVKRGVRYSSGPREFVDICVGDPEKEAQGWSAYIDAFLNRAPAWVMEEHTGLGKVGPYLVSRSFPREPDL